MTFVANLLITLIALLHIYILILEMFLWNTHRARKAFGTTKEEAEMTVVNAANQGLYNGFLAAGLFYGLIHTDSIVGLQFKVFFLSCIVIAGIYGAKTVHKKILFIQTVPAAIALSLIMAN